MVLITISFKTEEMRLRLCKFGIFLEKWRRREGGIGERGDRVEERERVCDEIQFS